MQKIYVWALINIYYQNLDNIATYSNQTKYY